MLKEITQELIVKGEEAGLEINPNKTKLLSSDCDKDHTKIGNYQIEIVEDADYSKSEEWVRKSTEG